MFKQGSEFKLHGSYVTVVLEGKEFRAYIGNGSRGSEHGLTIREAYQKLRKRFPSSMPPGEKEPPEFTQGNLDVDALAYSEYFEFKGHVFKILDGMIGNYGAWGERYCSCVSIPTQIKAEPSEVKFLTWPQVLEHVNAVSAR